MSGQRKLLLHAKSACVAAWNVHINTWGGLQGALPMQTSKTAVSPDEGVIPIRCHCAISMRDANLWLEAHHQIHIRIPLLLEG